MTCATIGCEHDAGDLRWCEACRALRAQLGVGRRNATGAAVEAVEMALADDLHTINRRGSLGLNMRDDAWRRSRRGSGVRPKTHG